MGGKRAGEGMEEGSTGDADAEHQGGDGDFERARGRDGSMVGGEIDMYDEG